MTVLNFPATPTNGQIYTSGNRSWIYNAALGAWEGGAAAIPGTVTRVGLVVSGVLHTVTNSPVTSSGDLTLTLVNQAANRVFAGPASGVAATPTMRALVAADIPAIAQSGVTNLVTDLAGKQANDAVSTLTFAASMALDFNGTATQRLALTNNVTFAVTANKGPLKTIELHLTADATSRTLTFPAEMVFIGPVPSMLAATKAAVLTLKCLSGTEVRAMYGSQL